MGEFGADGAGVDEIELIENFPQLRARGNDLVAAVGEKFGLQVRIGEVEMRKLEHIGLFVVLHAQRIQIRHQVRAVGVDLNQARHGALLGACLFGGCRDLAPCRRSGRSQLLPQALANRPMRNFAAGAPAEAAEILAPRRLHGVAVAEEDFVQSLNVIGVRAVQRAARQLLGK
jgi:hypothetical protein